MAVLLGFLQRGICPHHYVKRCVDRTRERDGADRDGYVDGSFGRVDRHVTHCVEYLFCGGFEIRFGNVAQNRAELVTSDASDHVTGPQAAVEPIADGEQYAVCGSCPSAWLTIVSLSIPN